MSSPKSSFVQGEPIHLWVDYYNDTDDEIGLPSGWMFGFDVLTVRTQSGDPVRRPFEQVTRGPGGRNQIQRIGPKAHFVFYSNLLDSVNLTDADSYIVRIATPNHAPEYYLDKKHPLLPPSKLFRGPIESNEWEFTITPGSGEAFDLIAKRLKEKTAGSFELCQRASVIVEKYFSSAYGPYAVMCEVDRLLYGEGFGPLPLKDRLPLAQALIDELQSGQGRFEYLDVALIWYAERLNRVGQQTASSTLLREIQRGERSRVARLYIDQLLSREPPLQ
jgi:hypothetical protein